MMEQNYETHGSLTPLWVSLHSLLTLPSQLLFLAQVFYWIQQLWDLLQTVQDCLSESSGNWCSRNHLSQCFRIAAPRADVMGIVITTLTPRWRYHSLSLSLFFYVLEDDDEWWHETPWHCSDLPIIWGLPTSLRWRWKYWNRRWTHEGNVKTN